MGFGSIWHWVIVLIVVLVLFGRGRISETMGDFGKGIKSFKKGMAEEADPPVPPRIAQQPPAAPVTVPAAGPVPTAGETVSPGATPAPPAAEPAAPHAASQGSAGAPAAAEPDPAQRGGAA